MPDQLPLSDAAILILLNGSQPATVADIQTTIEEATGHSVAEQSLRDSLNRLRQAGLAECRPPRPYEFVVNHDIRVSAGVFEYDDQ